MRRFIIPLFILPLLFLIQSCSSLTTMVSGVGTRTVLNPNGSATVRILVSMENYNSMVASYVSNAMIGQGFTMLGSDNRNVLISEKTLAPGDLLFKKDSISFIQRTNLFFYDNIRINYQLDLERLAGKAIPSYFNIKGYCKIEPPAGFFITGLNGEELTDKEDDGKDRTVCAWDFNLTNDKQQPIQVTFQHVNKLGITGVFLIGAFFFFRSRSRRFKTGMPNPPSYPPILSTQHQPPYNQPAPLPVNQSVTWQPQPPYPAPPPIRDEPTQIHPGLQPPPPPSHFDEQTQIGPN